MIEQVLKGKNIQKAIKQTVSNKGTCGVDAMPVDELKEYIQTHKTELFMNIIQKRYKPNAIKGVLIPKSNGSKRLLGIPTVTDRMLQQAVSQVIAPHFELTFKDSSYGFRPNRNAQQAILQAQKYIHEGYKHIVDIDLQNFFDEVEHYLGKITQTCLRKLGSVLSKLSPMFNSLSRFLAGNRCISR
jgi:RNA-directed DNA polymerase